MWEVAIVAAILVIFLYAWYGREEYRVNPGRVIRFHYTDWCGACKLYKPVWEQVKGATMNRGIVYVEIDEDVAHTPGIIGYPTILMVAENGRLYKYEGPAEFNRLKNWITAP